MPLPAALSDATLPLPHKPIITVNPTSHSRSSTSDSGISSASSSVDPAPSPQAPSAAQPASASLSLIGRLRAFLLRDLKQSSETIGQLQRRYRTPLADSYFLWSSALGTTGFFMLFLPIFFFWGFGREGREILNILAAGTYITSILKDILQVPRPHLPPVTRLSMEYHHLEYGFPSSHSASATSLALYAAVWLVQSSISGALLAAIYITLFLFWASVVAGRIYCGMHSFWDCVVGVAIGAGLNVIISLTHHAVESWLELGGWEVPLTIVTIMFLIGTLLPKTPIPCPCIGDAIAFTSVVAGSSLGRWIAININSPSLVRAVMGPGEVSLTIGQYFVQGLAKYAVGIIAIVLYRIVAKAIMPLVYSLLLAPIPPTAPPSPTAPTASSLMASRLQSSSIASSSATLASNNKAVTRKRSRTLESIPSVIDLDVMEPNYLMELKREERIKELEWKGRKRTGGQGEGEALKARREVFTKVVVYAGIGFIATYSMPLLFVTSGMGL